MVPGDYGAEWIAQALAARAYARLGRLDSAVVAGRRAVSAVERLRGTLASEALQSSYVVDRAEVYGDLVLTLLRLGRPAEAFAVADAARSRALLEYVGTARADARSLGTPAEIVESEKLLRRIDALMQLLRATAREAPRERSMLVSDPSATIMEELARTRARYEELMVRAAQSRSRVSTILGAHEARVEDIHRALRPHELLLEYMFVDSELVTFAATHSELRVFRHDVDPRSFTQRVWLLRDLWGTGAGEWRDGLPASRALYRALIAPVENADMLRDVTRLVIVPLGVMTQVPFAALAGGNDGEFLVRRYEVVLQPSSRSLVAVRDDDDSVRVASGSLPGEAFAPFPTDLPATEIEAAAFRASSSGWTAHVGRDATEMAVRRAMGTTAVVHVATHGVVNARNPVFSRIELVRPPLATLDDDGRLEVHEILGLTIRSPLVFLSGCETGANRGWSDDPVRGTGDLTLAQAVLAAGAPNVITTLWRIDDAGAADFAARFYRRLATGSVSTALAGAQRDMAADPRYASPYYWAGYTLSGTGDLRPQSTSPPSVSQSSHAGRHRTFSRSSP
jgi:CHAT domain-containing protein